jgi:GT2 family glycosyltransferase
VILNWNCWSLTLDCLQSLEALDYPNYHVVVVDNGSTDGSVAQLMAAQPGLDLIQTGHNLGFSGGCNVGIARAVAQEAEYVLLFNNDAIATPAMLRRMVDAAGEADAAITGARVMDDKKMTVLFDGRRWPADLFSSVQWSSHAAGDRWSESDVVNGCAMLIRKDILQRRLNECGYVLDPELFMYCEETDFCRYGIAEGYRCIVCHDAIAYHGVAKSSGGQGNPRSYYYLTRNRIHLASRWLGWPWKFVFHLYYMPSRLLLQFRRTRAARSAVWQGLKDGYSGVKGMWEGHGN